ncbi:MAG: glycosyltransferase family 1 protein [Candidatus Saccharibacteria bacterium]|nr:glycosyltransferase family 1 protein [Candidatus Saccharibacteria bacterium]
MKIGLVCPYNINKQGGVLEVVLALKAGLEDRGHTVKIITPQPRGGNPIIHPDDIIFFGNSTDFRSPSHTTAQVSSTADTEHLDDILETEQFDVLHFHEPWVPFLSRQILQRSTSVNIATFHAKIPETLMSRTVIKVVTPYLKSVMSYLHVYTAVSDSGAEYVAGLTDTPITIIPNGIDLKKYHNGASKKKHAAKTILYVGRLERRKGVKYLLQAYQLLAQDNPDVKLVIAGDGPDREKLELLAEDLKLPNVSFLGYVTEELKLKLLAEADLFCSPAIFGESFGIVLLEAMATGVVCVAGNNSGYSDVMQELGAVSIVNPHDATEFARRLDVLLHQDDLRVLWQKWAGEYIQQFSYPNIIDRYEELYIDALKQHEQH